jgi:hypothetical protein
MSGNLINRVFLARLAGTAVFDPNGDPVGKVRDALATLRANNQPPRILGLVVEVPLRRRVFVPITRVTSIESGTVIITGLLNMRRFESRAGEVLVEKKLLLKIWAWSKTEMAIGSLHESTLCVVAQACAAKEPLQRLRGKKLLALQLLNTIKV